MPRSKSFWSAALIWGGLTVIIGTPILLAAQSPYLEWRGPVYIAAGFAGIVALALLLLQPLLITRRLPGLSPRRARRLHRLVGALVLGAVVAHVVGLWLTSPPDVIDALLFTSPTPFSAWGVTAMWAVVAAAVLAGLRRTLTPRLWRAIHLGLALVIVTGSVVHAVLIVGTMETVSKYAICLAVIAATLRAVWMFRR